MTSCGRPNVGKKRDINNGEKYIILDISPKPDFMDKSEVTSSELKYYTGIPGKGLTTFIDLSTKSPNKKQKARFSITDIPKQDFRKLLKKFENSPYLGYKSKQVHNEPTEFYFFLIKYIDKQIKARGMFDFIPRKLNWASMKQLDMSTSNSI